MKHLLAFALLGLYAAECNPSPAPAPQPEPIPTPVPSPVPSPDPVPTPVPVPTVPPAPPVSGDSCGAAEANAVTCGCPLPSSGLTSWAEVCRNAAKNGVSMHQKCVADAKACPQIKNCLQSTK